MFTRANECQDVSVGDPDCSMERLQDEFGVDTLISHYLNAWQFLSYALKSEKDRDIIFRVSSPGAAWRSLVDTYSLKTQGASLALLHKLDSVRIGTNDYPTLKLLEMEDIARSLCSSHSQWQHLTESLVVGKIVNALPREYDIQKQMLEKREDGFSRQAVVSSVQKRFDSSAYKQLRRSKLKSGEIKPSRSSAGVRITPDAVDLVTVVPHSEVVGNGGYRTFSLLEPLTVAASHRIISCRKNCKRSSSRVRYTEADAGKERRRVLSPGRRILSAEEVRLIRVQAAAPQQAQVRGDQAFAVIGGGKNHPGRGGSRHGSKKPGGSQGGRGNGGSGGRGSSGGGASSGSSSTATAKPGGRACWVCKSDQHYVRDCPKQIYQGCDEKGHYITKCGNTDNAVMAVDMLSKKSTDDDSQVCPEADVEAYSTLEIKTGECLVSMMEEGGIRQMGDDLWLLDTGATDRFTHGPRLLENYAECSRVLRCAGGNTFPIVGTGTLRLSRRSGEGVVCVTLVNVAHVPGLSHHFLSLRRIADAGDKGIGTREGI